jgi:hypothetical protein
MFHVYGVCILQHDYSILFYNLITGVQVMILVDDFICYDDCIDICGSLM